MRMNILFEDQIDDRVLTHIFKCVVFLTDTEINLKSVFVLNCEIQYTLMNHIVRMSSYILRVQ